MKGTIFEKTMTPLTLWFFALYLFSVSKNGVSANELERQLGVSHQTAWRIANKIRGSMKQGTGFLSGVVEADEAYIGGRRRSSNRFTNKAPLLGAVQRGGEVRVEVAKTASAITVTDFLARNVAARSTLHTDESPLYIRTEKVYDRHSVKHSKFEFVKNEDDYTNTLEGFWGLFKPYLDGTHRSVSKKWLQFYVNEAVWKYNHRKEELYPLLLRAAVPPMLRVV
jgi:hypothetical protein